MDEAGLVVLVVVALQKVQVGLVDGVPLAAMTCQAVEVVPVDEAAVAALAAVAYQV